MSQKSFLDGNGDLSETWRLSQALLNEGKSANIRPPMIHQLGSLGSPDDAEVQPEDKVPRHRFNGPDWGLAQTELSEVVYTPFCTG